MEKLIPCPFCGGKAVDDELGSFGMVNEKPLYHWWFIVCKKCGCRTDTYKRLGWAIKAWNRRAK